MPRFRACFRLGGRDRDQVLSGKDSYVVKNTLERRYPGYSGLSIVPLPTNKPLERFQLSFRNDGEDHQQIMRAADSAEAHRRILDKYPKAQSLSIVYVQR